MIAKFPGLTNLLILFVFLLVRPAPAERARILSSFQAGTDAEPAADVNSDFWKDVKGVFITDSILGNPVTNLHAEVRSRWTTNNLYFLFIGHYDALTLKTNADTGVETYRLWFYDCFEVYVGADFVHTNRYRELEMSPQGEFLDLDIDSTKPRPGFGDERFWNSGMKVKASIDDTKKIWYGEIRVPMAAIDERPAQAGNEMQINFYRQDGKMPKRDFLAWQPTGVWNPHHPEKFGRLRLVSEEK
jgi:hypothetical protein